MTALVLADAILDKFGGDSLPGNPRQPGPLPPELRGLAPPSPNDRRSNVDRVFLVGISGAGKSSVAAVLAKPPRLESPRTATPKSSAAPPAPSPGSSATRARPCFAALSSPPYWNWQPGRARSSPLAAARSSIR